MIKLTPDLAWKTRDGKTVKIMEMAEPHLKNTIKFLERNTERLKDDEASAYGGMGGGDMSSYYAEGEACDIGAKLNVTHEWIAVLKQEAQRRVKEKTAMERTLKFDRRIAPTVKMAFDAFATQLEADAEALEQSGEKHAVSLAPDFKERAAALRILAEEVENGDG